MSISRCFLLFLFGLPTFASANIVTVYLQNYAENSGVNIRIAEDLVELNNAGVGFVDTEVNELKLVVSRGDSDEILLNQEFNLLATESAEIKIMVGRQDDLTAEILVLGSGNETIPSGGIGGEVTVAGSAVDPAGTKVEIVGQEIFTATDDDGEFAITAPAGVYDLRVSRDGYPGKTLTDVVVVSGITTKIQTRLSADAPQPMEEVLVMGVFQGLPDTSQMIERDASTITDSISTEELTRFGDSTAIAAVQRAVGVSVVDNQFAVVRGLAGRYISSTLDGGLLPSTDFLRRDVPLDLFPASILGGIDIVKSYSPELPGDTTGGVIGMLARGIPDERISKLSVSVGANTAFTGEDIITYEGGDYDFLGRDDGTREIPTSIDNATNYGRQNLPDVCLPPPLTLPGCVDQSVVSELGKSLPNIYSTEFESAPPEFGVSYGFGNLLEQTFGDLGFYGSVAYKQAYDARVDATQQVFTREGGSGFELSDSNVYQRSKRKVDFSAYFVAGLERDNGNSFTSKTIFLRKSEDIARFSSEQDIIEDKLFEETILQWVEQQMIAEKISGKHFFGAEENHQIDWHLGYAETSRYEPDKREYTYENGLLTPSRVFRRYTNLEEEAFDAGVDYVWDTKISGNIYSKLKAGAYAAIKDRDLELARFGFVVANSVDRAQDMESIFAPANFDSGAVGLRSQGQGTDFFNAKDDITAVYLSSETDFGEGFSTLLGARMEKGDQSIAYPLSNQSNAIEPLEYDEILPAFNLTWRATEDFQLRAGVSQTLSRPGLVERSNSQFFDPDTDEKIVGNPNLELSTIDNIDLRAEYYFSDEESVSIAVFMKEIDKPIEKSVPAGVREGYTFRNANSADLLGIELDFRKIAYDVDSWQVFVGGNATWIDSEVELDEQTAQLEGIQGSPRYSRPLQGQSEYLFNFQIGFDNFDYGQSVTLLVNYFDDRINRVDNVSRGDEIEKGRTLVDLVYQYEINEMFNLKAKLENILNEKVVFESEGLNQLSREEYENGTGIKLGLEMSF